MDSGAVDRYLHSAESCQHEWQHTVFAALAIEAGCEWITADRDFGRFPDLTWTLIDLR